jgi:hypothetical protein
MLYQQLQRFSCIAAAAAVLCCPTHLSSQPRPSSQPLDTEFRSLALEWSKLKGWPSPTVSAVAVDTITAANRDNWVAQIVDNIAIVEIAATTGPVSAMSRRLQMYRLADQPDFKSIRPQKLQIYKNSDLTSVGKTVFRASWAFPGMAPFETFGTAEGNSPRYEPVLWLTTILQPSVVSVHHSLITEDIKIPLTNGFFNWLLGGCADVRWRITIQTDDACHIVDPAPHIQQLACNATCADFTVACAKGEEKYTTPTCPPNKTALDCIKYATEMEYATGGRKVTANLGAGVDISGVHLDAGFTVTGDQAGEAGSKESIGQLCSDGFCVVDGKVVSATITPTPSGAGTVTTAPTSTSVSGSSTTQKGNCYADPACSKLLASGVTPGECVIEHDGRYWMGSDGVCRVIAH